MNYSRIDDFLHRLYYSNTIKKNKSIREKLTFKMNFYRSWGMFPQVVFQTNKNWAIQSAAYVKYGLIKLILLTCQFFCAINVCNTHKYIEHLHVVLIITFCYLISFCFCIMVCTSKFIYRKQFNNMNVMLWILQNCSKPHCPLVCNQNVSNCIF